MLWIQDWKTAKSMFAFESVIHWSWELCYDKPSHFMKQQFYLSNELEFSNTKKRPLNGSLNYHPILFPKYHFIFI